MVKGNEPENSSEEDEEIYEVEALLNHRRSLKNKGSKIDYLVKWFGYSEEYNTWEAEKNILSNELTHAYWKTQPISRSDFLKGSKKKRTVNFSENTKKASLTPETESHLQPELEPSPVPNKKLKVKMVEKTVLKTTPPSGLKWGDIKEVIDMFKTKENKLFGEVKWKNEEKTYILSDIIRAHNPTPLLKYYENHITFK